MKPSKIFLIATLFLFLVSSCRAVRHEVDKQNQTSEQVTTRNQSVTFKDTVFHVPSSTTTIALPMEVLRQPDSASFIGAKKSQPKSFVQSNGQATVSVKLTPQGIEATAECDSLAIRAQVRRELIQEFEKEVDTNNVSSKTSEVSIYYLSLAVLLGAIITLVIQFLKGK